MQIPARRRKARKCARRFPAGVEIRAPPKLFLTWRRRPDDQGVDPQPRFKFLSI